jgi:Putative zinc dependent peptidase (DUF5700)
MAIKFIYNKNVDNNCWKRYNDFIAKNGSVWGVTKNIKPIINIKQADFTMQVDDIEKKYQEIFGIKIRTRGYVVTTPFSMINDDSVCVTNGGVIYYSIYTMNPSVVIAHELFHIYFEKYTKRKIKNYDEAKEYFTVILNDIFGRQVSSGYPDHAMQRAKIFKAWTKTKSIDACIKLFK